MLFSFKSVFIEESLLTRDGKNVGKGNTKQVCLTVDDKYHILFHEIQLLFLEDFVCDFSMPLNLCDIFPQLLPPNQFLHI